MAAGRRRRYRSTRGAQRHCRWPRTPSEMGRGVSRAPRSFFEDGEVVGKQDSECRGRPVAGRVAARRPPCLRGDARVEETGVRDGHQRSGGMLGAVIHPALDFGEYVGEAGFVGAGAVGGPEELGGARCEFPRPPAWRRSTARATCSPIWPIASAVRRSLSPHALIEPIGEAVGFRVVERTNASSAGFVDALAKAAWMLSSWRRCRRSATSDTCSPTASIAPAHALFERLQLVVHHGVEAADVCAGAWLRPAPRRASIVLARLRTPRAHIIDGFRSPAQFRRRGGVRRRARESRSTCALGASMASACRASDTCTCSWIWRIERSMRSALSGLLERGGSFFAATFHVRAQGVHGAGSCLPRNRRRRFWNSCWRLAMSSSERPLRWMRSSISSTARSSSLTAVSVLRSVRLTRSVIRLTRLGVRRAAVASRVFSSMASSALDDFLRHRTRAREVGFERAFHPPGRVANGAVGLGFEQFEARCGVGDLGDAGLDAALGGRDLFLNLVDAVDDPCRVGPHCVGDHLVDGLGDIVHARGDLADLLVEQGAELVLLAFEVAPGVPAAYPTGGREMSRAPSSRRGGAAAISDSRVSMRVRRAVWVDSISPMARVTRSRAMSWALPEASTLPMRPRIDLSIPEIERAERDVDASSRWASWSISWDMRRRSLSADARGRVGEVYLLKFALIAFKQKGIQVLAECHALALGAFTGNRPRLRVDAFHTPRRLVIAHSVPNRGVPVNSRPCVSWRSGP